MKLSISNFAFQSTILFCRHDLDSNYRQLTEEFHRVSSSYHCTMTIHLSSRVPPFLSGISSDFWLPLKLYNRKWLHSSMKRLSIILAENRPGIIAWSLTMFWTNPSPVQIRPASSKSRLPKLKVITSYYSNGHRDLPTHQATDQMQR